MRLVVLFVLLAMPASAEDGRALFGDYCSIPYCHGPDGGEGRAPALAGRPWHESDLRRIIVEGIAGTSMPPFGDRLSESELSALLGFIRSISLEAASSAEDVVRAQKTPWDFASGRAIFHEGRCAQCHRFGRQDLAGPDLNDAVPKRPVEILRDIVEPGAQISGGRPFQRVETTSGDSFPSLGDSEDDEYVRVHDLSSAPPVLRRLRRDEIARIEPLPGSAMPADLWEELSPRQLLDLVFYVRSGSVAERAEDVATRPVDVGSDGTELSGDLFYPADSAPGEKLPAIVMSQGELDEAYAPYVAAEGFVVLTLDSRGEVRAEDVANAFHFLEREDLVDADRIGYWGPGDSKGHASWTRILEDIDGKERPEAIARAIEWFRENLGK